MIAHRSSRGSYTAGVAFDLDAYLARIGHRAPTPPTLETLVALHRAHLAHIPYENLDIHLGRRLTLDPAAAFDKLVRRRRGGWCYEHNLLFASVLEALGFDVQRLSGAVGRASQGEAAEHNHLVLLVTLAGGERMLADVGFGDAPLEPLPLRPGRYRQAFFEVGLSEAGGRWTFHNHAFGGAPDFDFTLEPRALDVFAERCAYLQTSPESGFVRTTVCQRLREDRLASLRGAVLTIATPAGVETRTLASESEYCGVLADEFTLHHLDTARLWAAAWTSHQAWLARARP